jgi:predicted MFS family arabinose efflux permease
VGAPIIGLQGDRVDRRRLLRPALVIFALDSVALTIAPTFAMAVIFRVLGGLASATLVPTTFALIAEVVPERGRSGAMGIVMLGMTLGIATGPTGAGLLTSAFGWRAPFIATAIGSLTVFALARACTRPDSRQPAHPARGTEPRSALPLTAARTGPDPDVPVSPSRGGSRRAMAWPDALRSVRRLTEPALLAPLVAKGAWLGAAVGGFLLSGELLRVRFGLDTAQVGGAVALFGLGLGAGNIIVGRVEQRLGRPERTLAAAVLLLLCSMQAFLLAPLPLIGSLACLAAWGLALGLAAPASTAILATRAGADAGFVLAVSESVNNAVLLTLLPIAAPLVTADARRAAACMLGSGPLLALLISARTLLISTRIR